MLQSLVLIDDLAVTRLQTVSSRSSGKQPPTADYSPKAKLSHLGYRIHMVTSYKEINLHLHKADAAILSVPAQHISGWRQKIQENGRVPILWWCDEWTYVPGECTLDTDIDGMLSPGMSPADIHCALMLSFNHYFQRSEWRQEREQLLSKLEERKWIEQAKRILSEIKKIPEAEAYEFLRKQAMNERKRIVDVAASIVKVYQLLQDQKKGGYRS